MLPTREELEQEYARLLARDETPDVADQGAGLRRVTDLGTDLVSGVVGVPQAFASLIPGLGGAANYLGDVRDDIEDWGYSDVRKAEQARMAQELGQADGFGEQAGALLKSAIRDPALAIGMIGQTIPAMLTGGTIAKGLGAVTKLGAPARAAIGEGTVAGAMTAAAIGEEGGDYYERLAGVPAGALVGLISGGSNRLIGKMAQSGGVVGAVGKKLDAAGDIDIALAGGAGAGTGSLASRMAYGGIREGVFEELPQSLAEQGVANLALGKDLTEDFGAAAAGGTLLGGTMGAGFSGLRGTAPEPTTERYVPTRGETDQLSETGEQVEKLSRARNEGLKTKSGELFKTAGAAKAAVKRKGLNPDDYEIIQTGGAWTALRKDDAVGLTEEGVAQAKQRQTEREAARVELEAELNQLKGVGKKSVEAVLGVKSAAELEALPASTLSKSRKETILQSDAFKKYVEAGAIPDFRAADESVAPAPRPKPAPEESPVAFVDEDTAEQEAGKPPTPQPELTEDEEGLFASLKSLDEEFGIEDGGDDTKLKATLPPSQRAKLSRLGKQVSNADNLEEQFGAVVANNTSEVFDDPGVKTGGVVEKKILPPEALVASSMLWRGFTDEQVKIDTAKGQKNVDETAKLASRAKRLLNAENDPKAQELVDIFTRLHSATLSFETAMKAYISDSVYYTEPKVDKLSAYDKETFSNPDTPEGLKVLADDPKGELDKQLEIVQQIPNTPRDKSAAGVRSLMERAEEIGKQIAELEQLVGRNNLRVIQYLIKRDTARTQVQVPNSLTNNQGTETSPAVRLHIYMKRYRDGRLYDFMPTRTEMRDPTDQKVEIPSTQPDQPVVYDYNSTEAVIERGELAGENAEGWNQPRMATNINRILRADNPQASTPIGAILAHIRDTRMSYSGLLAGRLLKLGEPGRRNETDQTRRDTTYSPFANARLILDDRKAKDSGENAYGYLEVDSRSEYTPKYTIWLSKDGQNESTALHEVIHLLTRGAIYQRRNPKAIESLFAIKNDFLSRVTGHPDPDIKYDLNRDGMDLDAADLSDEALIRLGTFVDAISKKPSTDIDEFVAWTMTDPTVQRVLAATPLRDPNLTDEARALNAKSVWQFFVAKIKALLGLREVPNSVLSAALDASSALLESQYDATATSLRPYTMGKKRGVRLDAAMDFDNPPPDMLARGEAARIEGQERGEGAKKIEDQGREYRERMKQQRKDDAAARAETMIELEDESRTAVPVARSKRKKDLTWVDQLGRTTMNALIAPLNKGTWQELTDGLVLAGREKIIDFVGRDGLAASALRTVIVNSVDKFGTTEQFRNILHAYARERQNDSGQAYATWEAFKGASEDVQLAVYDYIQDRDDAKLIAVLNDDSKVEQVRRTVADMETLLNFAKRLKVMREGQEEIELKDLIDYTDNPRYRRLSKRASGNVGIGSDARSRNFRVERVSQIDVIDKNGKQATEKGGKQYYKMLRADSGGVVFVEKGIDEQDVRKLNLVPDPSDRLPYRYEKMYDVDVQLTRRRTPEEMRSSNSTVEVVPSIVATMQDMSRRIEGARMNAAIAAAQEELGEDAWVTDEAPLDVDRENVIDLNLRSVTPKEALSKARRPGVWVRLPDNDSQWGDLQGKFMAGPAYASLQDFFEQEELVDLGAVTSAMRTWKKFKTVYSPVAHMNNIMGNVILSYYHDLPADNIQKALGIVINGARGKLTGSDQDLYDEFMNSGATLGAFNMAEVSAEAQTTLDRLTRKYKGKDAGIRNLTGLMTDMEALFGSLAAWTKGKDQALTNIYSNQDNVFRLAAYMTRIQQMQQANSGKVTAADKDEAALYAKQAFVDYAITAPWIVTLRNTALPFIAWPYRMVPLLSKLMLTKPWKAAATLGTVHTLNTLFTAIAGEDDEEEARRILDDYMKEDIWGFTGVPAYIRMPFGDPENATYFGVGRMIPLADLFNLANTGVPQTLAPSGPLMTLFNAVNNYDPFLNRPIADVTDTRADHFWKRYVKYLGGDMVPQALSSVVRTADKLGASNSSGERLGPLGSEPNAWVEMSRLFGVNMRSVNVPDQYFKQNQKITNLKRDFSRARAAALRSELRRGNPNVDRAYREMIELSDREFELLSQELGLPEIE